MNGWSKEGIPAFSSGKVPSDRESQGTWKRKNCALLSQLDKRFRVMVFLDAATGLRRSEFLALKWGDIDFGNLQINVRHSIYLNVVGNCKTEASRKPISKGAEASAAL